MRDRFIRMASAIAWASFIGLISSGWVRADVIPVDVELVLAVDVSLSMDPDEQRLQRDGYVEAITAPEVLAAIRANGLGRIGVVYMEWAGSRTQKVTVPWALIDGPASAQAFADRLREAPILRAQRTSISGGLSFASGLFETSGFRGKRRVIDVSGDGPNNDGEPVEAVRDRLVGQGVTINGLPIMIKAATGWFDLENLDEYYEDCVVGGFASFSVVVRQREEFAHAIKRKLLLEVADKQPRLIRTQATRGPQTEAPVESSRRPGREKVDCLIGEKRWQQFMGGRGGTF